MRYTGVYVVSNVKSITETILAASAGFASVSKTGDAEGGASLDIYAIKEQELY